jgi:hypothetical protein
MGSAIFLPVRDYAYPSEISIPVAPPWPYRQTGGPTCGASNNSFLRDHGSALASSLRKVGFPLPHCQRSFRRDSASGLRACPSSHSAHSLQGLAMETFYLHASWHTGRWSRDRAHLSILRLMCFPIPLPKPDMRLSPHPAFYCEFLPVLLRLLFVP